MPNILILFISLHHLGDYYLQFKTLVEYKERNILGVFLHSFLYSLPALVSLLFVNAVHYLLWIGLLCGSHLVIDLVKFYIKPLYFTPKGDNEANSPHNHLLKIDIRYFIDQFLHLTTIALITVLFLQTNSDIHIKQWLLDIFHIGNNTLPVIFKATAAFIVILQPVSLTFYKIFDIKLLANSRIPRCKDDADNASIDIKGTGAIIGFMERIIIMCLLILGEYTAIGFVIAGKSIIRLNSNVRQEFYIIGTFYGIITTMFIYILFYKL